MENLYRVMSSYILLGIGFVVLLVIQICIYRNTLKKANSSTNAHSTTKEKRRLKHIIVALCVYYAVLSFVFFPVAKDIITPQTDTVVGKVLGTSSSKGSYKHMRIETEDGEMYLIVTSGIMRDHDIDYGSTYEFEYFINSKTLKNAELLEDN